MFYWNIFLTVQITAELCSYTCSTSTHHRSPASVTVLLLNSVATFLISKPVKLQTKKTQNTTLQFGVRRAYTVSLRLFRYYCEALKRWRQQQILTGDTHSIKGLPQHPDVLWRASRCLPGRSDAPPHTSSWHQRPFLLSVPQQSAVGTC